MTRLILTMITVLIAAWGFSQNSINLSGYITDAETGERLASATVFSHEQDKGTTSNNYGYFNLNIQTGTNTLRFRYLGYTEVELKLTLNQDTLLLVSMNTNNMIDAIEVSASKKENFLKNTSMGVHRMKAMEVGKMPALLGEPDLIKALQTLPGVSFSTEGSTGMSVRGGSPDNTLIQLDGVPVYNVNHLWGFMSLFNNDAITEATLYKGSLPARFGGRLSSVLDISMKEGNLKKKGGTFSISPIAGRLTLEGPLIEDKVSYMISARRTWIDALFSAYQNIEGTLGSMPMYGFWDINAKTNWIINPRNRLYLSLYTGRDAYTLVDTGEKYSDEYLKFSYNWANLTGVARWNHIFSATLFSNFAFYNSRYQQQYQNIFKKDKSEQVVGKNNLNDYTHTADFDWFMANDAKMRFGYKLSSHKFNPDRITYQFDSILFEMNKDIATRNLITELYAEGENSMTDWLNINLGLRTGLMRTDGKNYFNLQPRIALNYQIAGNLSAKTSYSRMVQYLHQLQNSTLGIPIDMWVSATPNIRPGSSDQFSAGLFYQPWVGYKLSSEIYASKLHHLIRTQNGAFALKNSDETWESVVTSGKGQSKGIELMVEKTKGNLTGWINYTLSKTDWQFNEINAGQWFPSNYDRRHLINIYTNYQFSEKHKKGKTIKRNLSANYKYATGNYTTLAEQQYAGTPFPMMEIPNQSDAWFSQRELIERVNNYQMPNFHHLNLSYRIDRIRPDKTFSWMFSAYNVYNRHNPWYYYKKGDQLKQITMFPIIPTVTFTYTF